MVRASVVGSLAQQRYSSQQQPHRPTWTDVRASQAAKATLRSVVAHLKVSAFHKWEQRSTGFGVSVCVLLPWESHRMSCTSSPRVALILEPCCVAVQHGVVIMHRWRGRLADARRPRRERCHGVMSGFTARPRIAWLAKRKLQAAICAEFGVSSSLQFMSLLLACLHTMSAPDVPSRMTDTPRELGTSRCRIPDSVASVPSQNSPHTSHCQRTVERFGCTVGQCMRELPQQNPAVAVLSHWHRPFDASTCARFPPSYSKTMQRPFFQLLIAPLRFENCLAGLCTAPSCAPAASLPAQLLQRLFRMHVALEARLVWSSCKPCMLWKLEMLIISFNVFESGTVADSSSGSALAGV